MTTTLSLLGATRSPRPSCWTKDAAAVGDPHEHDHVDVGDVDTLVEQVAGGHDVERSLPKGGHGLVAPSRVHVARDRLGLETEEPQRAGKALRMGDGRTKRNGCPPVVRVECLPNSLGGLLVPGWEQQQFIQLRDGIAVARAGSD